MSDPTAAGGVESLTRERTGKNRGRVRLRTLIAIRWLAIAGQAATVVFVYLVLGYDFPFYLTLGAVAASAFLNIALVARYPSTKRLVDHEARAHLAYDVVQLAVLLFLTGGLKNPFAALILVPVTISATILSGASTVGLALLAIGCISLLAVLHMPLPWGDGTLVLAPVYLYAVWVALALGISLIAVYAWRVAAEARRMSDALVATQLTLAREQKLSALGGLAAAAAHELGTPLGTIAVVAKEMSRELGGQSQYSEDLALLTSQAKRCREILTRLTRGHNESEVTPYSRLPLSGLIEEAAEPYRAFGVTIAITPAAQDGAEPLIRRRPELLQGLVNLVENATEFATRQVAIAVGWDARRVCVCVRDDGPGFERALIPILGEPYISSRPLEDGRTHTEIHHEGMGLGIFIAKTLLEHTGATITFRNRAQGGAEVEIVWPRTMLEDGPPGHDPGAADNKQQRAT